MVVFMLTLSLQPTRRGTPTSPNIQCTHILFGSFVIDCARLTSHTHPQYVHMNVVTWKDLRQCAMKWQVGIHSVSMDGRNWSTPQIAYTLFANWSSIVPQPFPSLGRREAPQILLSNDGKATPVALFNAAMPCKCGCVLLIHACILLASFKVRSFPAV